MKIIVEIENDKDMKRVERFLKFLQPNLIRHTLEKANQLKDFVDFIDNEAFRVERIVVPSRKERNAR